MKKIVHISSVHELFDNRIFWKECKSLDEKYDLTLIIPHKESGTVEGIQVIGLERQSSRVKRMLITTMQAFQHALEEDARLYHLHDPELIPVGLLLRMKGKKVIFDMHENVPGSIRSKGWVPKKIRKILCTLYQGFEKLTLNRFGVIFAEKSYEREYPWIRTTETVLNMPKAHKIARIHNEKKQTPTIGYIGRIGPNRGSIILLDALKVLNEQGMEVHFECVGGGADPHLNQLQEIAQSNGLTLRLHGFLKPEEGLKIMASCHIGMAILMPVPNYLESLPTKIFEYMALGLPVIASNFPLYKSIVEEEECGICVNPENEHEVAEAIQWLIRNPQKAREMGERGREAVLEKYSWQNEEKKLYEFYEQVID